MTREHRKHWWVDFATTPSHCVAMSTGSTEKDRTRAEVGKQRDQ